MKKTLIVIFMVVALTMVSFAASNAAYNSWKNFKPGTFVAYKANVKTMAATVKTEITFLLKGVKKESVDIEVKTVTETMGQRIETPAQMIEITADGSTNMSVPGLPVQIPNINTAGADVAGGTETFKVKGKEIKVKATTVNAAGNTVKLLVSEEIPGLLVKTVTETGSGMTGTKVEMVLVDYKIVK